MFDFMILRHHPPLNESYKFFPHKNANVAICD